MNTNKFNPAQTRKPQLIKKLEQKQNRKLTLHKETIKELTDDQLQNVAGGTSSTILLTLISLREHICL